MGPLCVPPMDPGGGLEFDLLDRTPGIPTVDEPGLVEPVNGLGEGTVR